MHDKLESLHELAAFHRLETAYWDGLGNHRTTPVDAVLAVLKSLGVDIDSPGRAAEALAGSRHRLRERWIEPVVVLWEGRSPRLDLRLSSGQARDRVSIRLDLEAGETLQYELALEDPIAGSPDQDAGNHSLVLPDPLPFGYHRFQAAIGDHEASGLLLSAPLRAFTPPEHTRTWGTFLPLYSLHTERSLGAGELSDFRSYAEWIRSLGGDFVATLPLFAAFLDDPCEPSPYSPLSRKYWNEFYIDWRSAPNWSECHTAQQLAESVGFREEIRRLRSRDLIDYPAQWHLIRSVLELLSRDFFSRHGRSDGGFRNYLETYPEAEQYARFRAVQEREKKTWKKWGSALRSGTIPDGTFDKDARNLYLYAQWLAAAQIDQLSADFSEQGAGLYMDLPLGTHPDGFDCWHDPGVFASGVTGGAPPDGFFTQGQNWGFQPIHPENIRRQGYRYLRQVLEPMTACSAMIRIDHAMSLQRLYWIPDGFRATDGVYVHYPTDELFAVLTIESRRSNCLLVGEDLGTVTPKIRQRLERHGVFRMYVAQFECAPHSTPPFHLPIHPVVASLNTHDTPTAAAFWQGRDIDLRLEMGLLDEDQLREEHRFREEMRAAMRRYFHCNADDPSAPQKILQSWMLELARSPAAFFLVNLEDLWLETEPQNIPGTGHERPNWRRKAARSLEEMRADPDLAAFFQNLESARKGS